MKKVLKTLLLSILYVSAWAAEPPADSARHVPLKPRFLYNVDAAIWFDNREYHEPWQTPQTFFSIRLSPSVGVGVTDNAGGEHRVMAGVHYTQPMGGNWKEVTFHPIAFYQYKYRGLTLNMGEIPYTYFIRQLPDFMRYDSIVYAQPNIQGALFQYQSKHGFVEAMCDWRALRRVDQREQFRVTIDGEYSYQGFFRYFIGGIAQMNHKANYSIPTTHEGVGDDIIVSPNIGIDFSSPTPLCTLSLRASYIYAYQFQRKFQVMCHVHSFMLEFMMNWKWIGAKNTFYYGDNLMPFYYRYHADMNQGDPFYQSPIYNRTDFYFYLIRKSFINCYFSWNLHWEPIGGLQHQQQLIAVFSLDGIKRGGTLRGLFDK